MDTTRCSLPQPPDGKQYGCGTVHSHSICQKWIDFGISDISQIETAISYFTKINETTATDHIPGTESSTYPKSVYLIPEQFENNIIDQDYMSFDTVFTPVEEERFCYYLQPPDGRTRGCGEMHMDSQLCNSWKCWGVVSISQISSYIVSYRKTLESLSDRGNVLKYCHRPQPPPFMTQKGCGHPPHRGLCISWRKKGVHTEEQLVKLASTLTEYSIANWNCEKEGWLKLASDGYLNQSVHSITRQIMYTLSLENAQFQELGKLYWNRSLLFQRCGWNDCSLSDIDKALLCEDKNLHFLYTKAMILCSSPVFAVSSKGTLNLSESFENKRKHFIHECIKTCSLAIRFLPSSSTEIEQTLRNSLMFQLLIIRAGCYMWKDQYEDCVDDCSSILEDDPQNLPALMLRGIALSEIGAILDSQIDLSSAFAQDPSNKDLQLFLESVSLLGKRKLNEIHNEQ